MVIFRVSIFITFLIVLFSSCEKDADGLKIPNSETQVVVTCFLDPDNSRTEVFLDKTKPLRPINDFGNDYLINSKVSIFLDGLEYSCILDSSQLAFRTIKFVSDSLPRIPGKSYTLFIKFQDGRIIRSQTKIPEHRVDSTTVSFNYSISHAEFQDSFLNVRCNFKAIQGRNFYRIIAYVGNRNIAEFDRPEFENINENNNNIIESGIGVYRFFRTFDREITLVIINSGEDYYKFHRSITKEMNANLIYSEPVFIYSNIEGGIGCFAGSRRVSLKFKI